MKKYLKFLWKHINDSYSTLIMGGGLFGYTVAGTIDRDLSFDGYLFCIGTIFTMLLVGITISFFILKARKRI